MNELRSDVLVEDLKPMSGFAPIRVEPTSSRTRLTCHGGGGLNPRHAPPRGRVRATGVGRRGGLAPLGARGSARTAGADAGERDEGARPPPTCSSTSPTSRSSARSGSPPTACSRSAQWLRTRRSWALGGRGRAADPGGGRCDDRRRRCEIAAPSEVTSASAIRRTTCLRCWLHSTRRSRSAAPLESVSFRRTSSSSACT